MTAESPSPAGASEAAGAASAAPDSFAPPPPGDPPRNVSNSPPPPEVAATEPRPEEAQWALVLREFRKRKVAAAAAALLVALVTISIFAPLLANDRPIAYSGANRYEYAEAARNARALLAQAGRAASPEKASADAADAARQLGLMAAVTVPETADAILALRDRLRQAAADGLTADEANGLRRDVAGFPADEVEFLGRWRFPVFAVLHGTAVGFMAANAVALLLLFARLLSRRPWRKRTRRAALLALLFAPIIVGTAWELAVPELIDRTPYKRGVPAEEAGDTPNAPVIYQAAVWPPVPFGLDETDLDAKFARPAILNQREGDQSRALYDAPHWLGTDKIGRDVLSRMLWGGRVSLAVGVLSVTLYVAIGIVVGSIAGFFRGWADLLISRLIEIVIVFPAFFLILTIVAFLGPSLWNIMIVIGLTGWTGVARLVRGEFLRLADQEFVLAGRALGYSAPRLIFRHILPNALAPVLVAATFGVAGAILTESALSFLGIGITVPTPSWGGILAEGRDFLGIAPWLIYIPGLAIFLTILSYNLAGEALRDASDPRLRGSR